MMTVGLGAALALTACGGGPAVELSAIPPLPGATVLGDGQNLIGEAAADTLEQQFEAQDLDSDVSLYAVPAGTTWEQVRTFYEGQLADSDWESEPALGAETEAFSAAGWSRGGLASEQALVVGYGPDVLGGGGGFLLIALASE